MSHFKTASIWTFTVTALIFAIAIFTLRFGAQIEALVAPPYIEVKAQIVKVEQTHTDVVLTGVKGRDCFLVTASAKVRIQGSWIDGQALMMDKDGKPLEVYRQRIAKGDRFVRFVRVTPASDHLIVNTESLCHAGWLSKQELFEIDSKNSNRIIIR